MAYKDSFVDEFPYLVYSDDPEAVGGAGGGDIGFTPDETAPTLSNLSDIDISDIPILADAEGRKTITVISIANDASILIAPNAYIGLPEAYYIYVGDFDAGERMDPAGSFTMGEINFNTYQITDPDESYSIYAS